MADAMTIAGRYRVLDRIDARGTAEIYSVRDLHEERIVALR